jgi:hypothetical protein
LNWLHFQETPHNIEVKTNPRKGLKNPNIPILPCYKRVAAVEFWNNFPYKDLPLTAESDINALKLENLLLDQRKSLTDQEFARGLKAIRFLKEGAPSFQKKSLGPIYCKNEPSAYQNGASLTDSIAEWVKAGFVAGPFRTPPLPKFRVNPLKVVVQENKDRPILNVSSPFGSSFNDNVDELKMERVRMSSPQKFSQSLRRAGRGA